MITVTVNQKTEQIQENTSLQKLIDELNISSNGIAIAINQNIIKRDNWTSQRLLSGDNILIIKATQGG
ncbi:sulfur carrier protein ThiS [Pseudofulvibacter geojedonensis]|uniref:Sulfur carrier protein ThiS n=1 Tax=Pseudofulvibacter geojedonensis TaxID=1123758 RepID=A0ABW3I1G8_9FLAO